MTAPTAVLFDWDNTLVDTAPLIHACFNAAMAAVGREPWPLEKVQVGIHRSARDSFPALFGEDWPKAQQVYYKAFKENHLEQLQAMQAMEALVQSLHAARLPMAVVSNKTGPYLRKEVSHLGWDAYFGSVVGAQDAAHDKPHPAPVEMALAAMGLQPSEDIWFIGDTETDMHVAHRAGLKSVLIRQHSPLEDEFQDCKPHLYVENGQALTEILRNTGLMEAHTAGPA